MPYIKDEDRDRLYDGIERLAEEIRTVGELNYVVTRLSLRLLKRMGLNYNNISNVIGTLTLIPSEIGRRFIHPYEDAKIKENGDVYEFCDYFWEKT